MDSAFIIVPEFDKTGPVKGAIALANGLSNKGLRVTLVSIKGSNDRLQDIDREISILLLSHQKSWLKKIHFLQNQIRQNSSQKIIAISFCFSADLINVFNRHICKTACYIRGNLFKNYYYDYGYFGKFFALFHLLMTNLFHFTIVMSESMNSQISKFSIKKLILIRNFIDETQTNRKVYTVKGDTINKFFFLGSLTNRKRPEIILYAIEQLKANGYFATIDFFGDGPLKDNLVKLAHKLDIANLVNFRGFIANPSIFFDDFDVMILPSESEGIPRSAMECLYHSIPCVLRNTDGNSELISHKINGSLFSKDSELYSAMLEALTIKKNLGDRKENLLPSVYSQSYCTQQFIEKVVNDC